MQPGEVFRLNLPQVADELCDFIRESVFGVLKRRGAVVGISGGVDSSVVAALCARALGPDRTLGLLMPERDSSRESHQLGRLVARTFGIECLLEDIEPVLEAAGCYRRQVDAVRQIFPEFGPDYKLRLTLPSLLESDALPVSRLTIESPAGEQKTSRMTPSAYLELVAATNFKQRVRKMIEYHHADRLRYAVMGTPNRLEYDQGFFVKNGDGAADVKPIAHLYKTQVYALARHLAVPAEVTSRPPTSDTFSLPHTQEEFYFRLPWDKMDLCLWGHDQHLDARELAPLAGLSPEQVRRAYADIEQKRRVAEYLASAPLMVT